MSPFAYAIGNLFCSFLNIWGPPFIIGPKHLQESMWVYPAPEESPRHTQIHTSSNTYSPTQTCVYQDSDTHAQTHTHAHLDTHFQTQWCRVFTRPAESTVTL